MDVESTVATETSETYKTPNERAAYRAGMSTSAAVCDWLAALAAKQDDPKIATKLAAMAKRCGDEIWRIRETIRVND